MNAAGLYVRVSTTEQAKSGYSVGEQTERLRSYASAMGWPVFRVYTDAGFSGSNMNRPALQQLLRDVDAGKVQKVVVYKLDRLSRSQKDTLELIEDRFLRKGVDFVSLSESFDTSSPFGRATIGIMAAFAQLERETIKERMQMGREARIKAGKFKGAWIDPIGYTYKDGALHVDEYEADLVRQIFALARDHMTPGRIAEEMNAQGLVHRSGLWSPRQVRKTLRSRLYIGEVSYHEDWYPGIHEPIVDRDVFDDVQVFLDGRAALHRDQGQRTGKIRSNLGGLLYCAQCGGKFSKRTTRTVRKSNVYLYEVYVCNSRAGKQGVRVQADCKNKIWKMAELEALIFGEVEKLALDPDWMRSSPAPGRNDRRISVLEKRIKKQDDELSRLIDLYGVGKIPVDLLEKKILDAQERREAAEEELDRLREEARPKMTVADAAEEISSFADVLETGDQKKIHAVLSDLIERIEIDGEDVSIFWSFM